MRAHPSIHVRVKEAAGTHGCIPTIYALAISPTALITAAIEAAFNLIGSDAVIIRKAAGTNTCDGIAWDTLSVKGAFLVDAVFFAHLEAIIHPPNAARAGVDGWAIDFITELSRVMGHAVVVDAFVFQETLDA